MKRSVNISKKDEVGMNEWWCMWYCCPKCNNNEIADGFKYCPKAFEKESN